MDSGYSIQVKLNGRLVLLVALAYFVLGALGLSFAIQPGYASPIFPAAGLAAAVMLWSGNRLWAGIFLGSFALNIGVSWLNADLGLNKTIIAFVMALGATTQAWVAAKLVTWATGKAWRDMEFESDIMLTLLLAGGLACVVSASVGVTTLYLSGVISSQVYLKTFWSWWVGDSLGVLILMPIVLSILYRHHPSWYKRFNTVVLPMLGVLLIVASIVSLANYWEQNLMREQIRKQGENFKELLERRYIAHKEAIASLARLIEVTPLMHHEQFQYFTRNTLLDNQDISALSFNPIVQAAFRTQFERDMAEVGFERQFSIKQRNNEGQLVRAAEHPTYVPVAFIAPLEENRNAVGYDIYSESIRQEAINSAFVSGEMAVTAPIELVQGNAGKVGLLLMHPAKINKLSAYRYAEDFNLLGLSIAVIKMDEFIQIATAPNRLKDLVYQIHDVAFDGQRQLLFRSHDMIEATNEDYLWKTSIEVANRMWEISVSPTNNYLQYQPTPMAWFISVIGLFITAILQVLMLVITGRTNVVERTVEAQTAELQRKSNQLQDSNLQLNTMFVLSPDGFVAISAEGFVQYVNPAFEEITGITSSRIIQQHETALDAELKLRAYAPDTFKGIAAYFSDGDQLRVESELILQQPKRTVLQMIGMNNNTSNLTKMLYLRDVTAERELADMKTEFVSHAAHELRTPMTSIYGYIELMLTRRFDEDLQREMLQAMQRQSLTIVNMINELLDLARIDARGGKDFTFEKTDINQLLTKIVSDLQLEQAGRNIELCLAEHAQWVYGDSAKLSQAIMNVFVNAEKYSEPHAKVHMRVIAAEQWIGVSITDHGIGMSEEEIRHIGERFWRAEHSGSRPGTGLGMSIVKEILRFHDGDWEIQSTLGHGTTVTLWLPAMNQAANLVSDLHA
jgi:signal transduction histidine kinase/CHASE1-domain containing sensor protein